MQMFGMPFPVGVEWDAGCTKEFINGGRWTVHRNPMQFTVVFHMWNASKIENILGISHPAKMAKSRPRNSSWLPAATIADCNQTKQQSV
jgi:hypothetical protein